MKKTILLFTFLLAGFFAQAQNASMQFIPFHNPGFDIFQYDSRIIQQRDGDLIVNVLVGTVRDAVVDGNIFYKVSPTGLQYVDSLFEANTQPPFYMFAQDPRGEGNLRFNFEPEGNGGTALRISHFSDSDLNINHVDDVLVHLHDSTVYEYVDSYLIDSQGDLILKYYYITPDGSSICHIARYGLDGTLKHAAILPESQNYINTMEEFESTPKRYFQWKRGYQDNLYIYQLDSTFQVVKQNIIDKLLFEHFYGVVNGDSVYMEVMKCFHFGNNNSNSTFVVPDGDDMLIAAPYDYDSGYYYEFHESGAAIARYNMNTLQMKALAHFNDQPDASTDIRIMCFQKTCDGDFFLVYREPTPSPESLPTMTVAKLDNDLNVIWKRYCFEPGSFKIDPYWSDYSGKLYDENGNEMGIYVAGEAYRPEFQDNGMFFFFLTDETLSIEENGLIIRPYAYYPNPAQDELHLQYSPDVKPIQIELFDIQGRIVRLQRNGLERLNLQGLPAGTYTMRVTLEGGLVFSDKVVKE